MGRHRDRHGSTRNPQHCLFGHRESANFEWVWGSLWARIGTATQPIHPPINLTAQLLKRGGGSARQGNWIEKSMAVFYASASLPRRNKLNDQINKKRPHKRTTKKPHNATRCPGGMRELGWGNLGLIRPRLHWLGQLGAHLAWYTHLFGVVTISKII